VAREKLCPRLDLAGGLVGNHGMRRGELTPALRELNSTLGVVATSARINKVELMKTAPLAHLGWTQAMAPIHTIPDGGLMFALSLVSQSADLHRVRFAAVDLLAEAIVGAVTEATSRGGIPCYAEITGLAPE
jgi:L-aminopeptidase/D-esterase-like protein